MKTVHRFLKWAAVALLGVPTILYSVWIAGNIGNDELNPEITELLAHRPSQINEKANAYFDIVGLGAPQNVDPHSWGVSWFAQASANDRALLQDQPVTAISLPGYPLSHKPFDLPCSQRELDHTCLEEIQLNPSIAQKYLENGAILLHRFDALLDKDYQEPRREMIFMSEFAPLWLVSRTSKLAQLRIALEITKGHDTTALARWGREVTFALRQAKNSHTLIDKLVHIAALNRYQRLLANYVSMHPKAARARAKQLVAMLELFDKSAVSLQPAFESEAVFSTRSLLSRQLTLDSFEGDGSIVAKIATKLAAPLFDPQATANEIAHRVLNYARIAALEGDAYRASIAETEEKLNRPSNESVISYYRNPVGRLIFSISSAADYSKYLYKSDEIIANKKLLGLTIDLLLRNIKTSEQIAKEITANHADLKHPFSGELPLWNEKERTLSYVVTDKTQLPNYVPLVIRL